MMLSENAAAACRTLFGDELAGLRTLIMTPLTPIFEIYAARAQRKTAGWWPTCDLGDGVFAVKCPTGRHSSDALWFAPRPAECFLLGFCGALGQGMRTGDLFCATEAHKQCAEPCTGLRVSADHEGALLHVDSLHEQREDPFWQAVTQTKALCVDMETYPVFRVANQCGVAAASLLVISDHLTTTPFYRCSTEDLGRVRASLVELSARVRPGSLSADRTASRLAD